MRTGRPGCANDGAHEAGCARGDHGAGCEADRRFIASRREARRVASSGSLASGREARRLTGRETGRTTHGRAVAGGEARGVTRGR